MDIRKCFWRQAARLNDLLIPAMAYMLLLIMLHVFGACWYQMFKCFASDTR